jgi:hypothetical protein
LGHILPWKDEEKKKAYHKAYGAKWYRENKQRVIEGTRKNREKHKKKWREFKASLSCEKCGFSHPAALDFHHKNSSEKENDVSLFINQGMYKRAYEEVKKCIALCANCHRIHHWNERERDDRNT